MGDPLRVVSRVLFLHDRFGYFSYQYLLLSKVQMCVYSAEHDAFSCSDSATPHYYIARNGWAGRLPSRCDTCTPKRDDDREHVQYSFFVAK